MKRLWLAAGILCLLFTAALLNSFYLKGITQDISGLLAQAETQAEAEQWTLAEDLTAQALTCWEGHSGYLYTFFRHENADQVNIGFQEVLEFLRCQERGEYSAANARLMAQLDLLYEMERLSLKNLL